MSPPERSWFLEFSLEMLIVPSVQPLHFSIQFGSGRAEARPNGFGTILQVLVHRSRAPPRCRIHVCFSLYAQEDLSLQEGCLDGVDVQKRLVPSLFGSRTSFVLLHGMHIETIDLHLSFGDEFQVPCDGSVAEQPHLPEWREGGRPIPLLGTVHLVRFGFPCGIQRVPLRAAYLERLPPPPTSQHVLASAVSTRLAHPMRLVQRSFISVWTRYRCEGGEETSPCTGYNRGRMLSVLPVNRDVGQTMDAQHLHGSKREDQEWRSRRANRAHALEFLLPINGTTYAHLWEIARHPTCLNVIAPCSAANEIRRVSGREVNTRCVIVKYERCILHTQIGSRVGTWEKCPLGLYKFQSIDAVDPTLECQSKGM